MGLFPFERAPNQAVLAAQDSETKALKAGPSKDGVGLQSTKLKKSTFYIIYGIWINMDVVYRVHMVFNMFLCISNVALRNHI